MYSSDKNETICATIKHIGNVMNQIFTFFCESSHAFFRVAIHNDFMLDQHIFQKSISIFTSFIVIAIAAVSLMNPLAHADFKGNTRSFSFCPNPGGNVIASFNDGSHWIVGNQQLQNGRDTVNDLGNNTFTQCFCPLSDNNQLDSFRGTQTNFLSTANMSAQERQARINSGWIVVADGSVFGLPSGEFLARNSSFSCNNRNVKKNVFQNKNNNIERITPSKSHVHDGSANEDINITKTTENGSNDTNVSQDTNTAQTHERNVSQDTSHDLHQ